MSRARWAAAGVAAVLLAGGLVAAVVVTSSGCGFGSTDAAVRADARVDPLWDRLRREDDPAVLGRLAAAGLPGQVAWGLWSGAPDLDGEALPEVTDVTAVGNTLVTVQETAAADRLLAGYAAGSGELRWQASVRRPELYPAGELLVVGSGRELTAVDPVSGQARWCLGTGEGQLSVLPVPGGVLVAEQDGADSTLRVLDAATGEERWSVAYESHDAGVPPVVTTETVSVFVVDREAGGSGTRTYGLPGGRPEWTSTVDFPRPVAGTGDTVLLRGDAGLQAADARTGRILWTSPALDAELRIQGSVRPGSPALLLQDTAPLAEPAAGGGLTAFDPATGAVRWRLAAADLQPGGRVRAVEDHGGRLLVHAGPGLVVVDPDTGAVLARAAEDPVSAVAGDVVAARGPSRMLAVRI